VVSPLPRNSAAADVQFMLCSSIVLLLVYGECVNCVEHQTFVSGTHNLNYTRWSFLISTWVLNIIGIAYAHIIDADPVAMLSKAWVCGRLLAGVVGSNPTGDFLSLVSVVCWQVEVSATSC